MGALRTSAPYVIGGAVLLLLVVLVNAAGEKDVHWPTVAGSAGGILALSLLGWYLDRSPGEPEHDPDHHPRTGEPPRFIKRRLGEEKVDLNWVIPQMLAAGSFPGMETRTELQEMGIQVLINLTSAPYSDDRFEVHTIPVDDGEPPEPFQVDVLMRLLEQKLAEKRPVYVHCLAGCGRTGTMLACYLVKSRGFSGAQAIQEMRRIRACSIENPRQEAAVTRWAQFLEKRPPEKV